MDFKNMKESGRVEFKTSFGKETEQKYLNEIKTATYPHAYPEKIG